MSKKIKKRTEKSLPEWKKLEIQRLSLFGQDINSSIRAYIRSLKNDD